MKRREYKMMKSTVMTLLSALLLLASQTVHANWQIPLTVTDGNVTAEAGIGVENGATEGYDPGRDIPVLEPGTITAWFAHPEWGVKKAGESFPNFYQEIKGERYPAVWEMTVESAAGGVHRLSWELPERLPRGFELRLYPPAGGEIDMVKETYYSYTPSAVKTFRIEAGISLNPVPLSPTITELQPRNKGLQVSWEGDDDAAGYKVHFGSESGVYERTIDVRKSTNLRIGRLTNGETCYVAVTAYNDQGVESAYSQESSGVPFNSLPTSPVASWRYFEAGEDVLLEIGGAVDADGEAIAYDVEVYSDRNMKELVASANTDDATVNLGELEKGTYYWRARATDGTDYSSWSGTRVIRVDTGNENATERVDKAYGRKRY